MKFSREILKGSAPFVVLQVLHTLKSAYGYQLVTEIKHRSSGVFEFAEGTLYPLLYRLEDQQLVTSFVQKTEAGKDRRYYKLTTEGQVVLEEKQPEMEQLILGLQTLIGVSTSH